MFEIDRVKFGAFVALLRKEKGITQKELAEKLAISDKAISKWETGNSIPDVTILVPLAEELGVSVTELLECRKIQQEENMDTSQTDVLVKKVIELSEEERQRKKRKNQIVYFVCVLIAVLELFGVFQLYSLGMLSGTEYLTPIMIVSMLSIGFGAYIWLGMKEKLPAYYDENKINVYVDGLLHMNMPGVYYNNNNWPYIVMVLKAWSVVGMIVFPWIYIMLNKLLSTLGPFSTMIPVFAFVFGGLFIPIYVLARKYEYGDTKRPSKSHEKKDKKKIIGAILVIAVVAVLIYMFHGSATIGSGNRIMFISNEGRNYWSATYQYFDGFQQRTLIMEEVDALDVAVITDEGQLDIKITDEKENIIFEKKDLETGSFSMPVSGYITIRVDATKHKGSFSFD